MKTVSTTMLFALALSVGAASPNLALAQGSPHCDRVGGQFECFGPFEYHHHHLRSQAYWRSHHSQEYWKSPSYRSHR